MTDEQNVVKNVLMCPYGEYKSILKIRYPVSLTA